MDGEIRILIADDQAAVRRALGSFLALQTDMSVVGQATDGAEAVRMAEEQKPDVILMDLVMPRLDGIGAAQQIRALLPQAKVLVLTSFADDDRILPALGAGVSGYLVKDVTPDQIADAIRTVHRGEPYLHPDVTRLLIEQVAGPRGPQGTVTVLVTDIEGSTRMVSDLGDRVARDLVRAHEEVLRDRLREYGGTEVKHTGDGLMTVFSSARSAVACAVQMQRSLAGEGSAAGVPVRVRMGLNSGEAIIEDRDYFGEVVIIATRVMTAADGGHILLSESTKGLAEGAGFHFADRGEHVLKGVPQPRKLYEVLWGGGPA